MSLLSYTGLTQTIAEKNDFLLIPFLFEDVPMELTQNCAVGAIPCGKLKLHELPLREESAASHRIGIRGNTLRSAFVYMNFPERV